MADSVIAGGWTDCANDSEEVEEVAKFAVDEYNKEHDRKLKLEGLLNAQIMNRIGATLYKMHLAVRDEDGRRLLCVALVSVTVTLHPFMTLLEFYIVPFNQEIIGGWTDAGNDVGIEELAKFAVDEYNKKEETTLEFTKLKNAQKQLVAGILYRLNLEAIDDGHKKLYQAMVIVKSWEKVKELVDFKPLLLNDED